MDNFKKVTFVITTMGRLSCLEKVVVSLKTILDEPNILIGLQQDEVDAVFLDFAEKYKVEIVATGDDSGLSLTRNKLFEFANTDFIFLLDDDFVFESHSGVEMALDYIIGHDDVGVIGGKLYDRDLEKTVERNYEHRIHLDLKRKSIVLEPVIVSSDADFVEVDVVLNFGLFRRTLFTKYKIKWDENIKINGEHEDYYLTYKSNTKLKVVYMPRLYAFHERSISEEYSKYRYRNEGYFYLGQKWNVECIILKDHYVQELTGSFLKKKYQLKVHGSSIEKINFKIFKFGDKAMSKVKQLWNVYSKEGVIGLTNFIRLKLAKKVGGESTLLNAPRYVYNEYKSFLAPDKKAICSFRDKYKGERCFIVGNGPSLNKLDLKKLEDEVSFGVNGIFYKFDSDGFVPDFYIVEDSHVVADNLDRIISFKPKKHKFFPTDYKKLIGEAENTSFFRMNHGFYEQNSPNYQTPRFSTDFSEVAYCGQSVTMINLQLAYYMGFSEVYLIGMDFSYTIPKSAIIQKGNITSTEDDVNHFHPDYFGKGKKWHDPLLDQVSKTYEMYNLLFMQAGRKIINATAGGNLEVFEREDYDELF